MKLLLILSILLVPPIILATLLWWRIGDNWADNEHKRFKDKPRPTGADAPRVISSFHTDDTPSTPTPALTPDPAPDRDHPGA